MPSFAPNSSCPSGASICLPPCKKKGSVKYARNGKTGKCILDDYWLSGLPESRQQAIIKARQRNRSRSKVKRPYASSKSYDDAIDAVVRSATRSTSRRKSSRRRK